MEPLHPIFYSRKLFVGTGLVLLFGLRNQILVKTGLTPAVFLMYLGLFCCVTIIMILTAMKRR
ncbi:MAG: hypothetical protein AAGC45_02075 [Bacteroidota bacterium]